MFSAIRHKWYSYRYILSIFGWGVFLRQVISSLLRKVSIFIGTAIVYCIDTAETSVQSPETKEIEFRFIELDEIDEMDEELASQSGLTPDMLRLNVKKGDRCFIGTKNGTKCYFSIVSYDGFTIPRRFSVSLSSEDAYVGNCYTRISHRGLGIYPAGIRALARELAAEGKKWLYLYVDSENESSIRGVKKAGFYPVAKSSVWGLGPILRRKWYFLSIDQDEHPAHEIKHWSVKAARKK